MSHNSHKYNQEIIQSHIPSPSVLPVPPNSPTTPLFEQPCPLASPVLPKSNKDMLTSSQRSCSSKTPPGPNRLNSCGRASDSQLTSNYGVVYSQTTSDLIEKQILSPQLSKLVQLPSGNIPASSHKNLLDRQSLQQSHSSQSHHQLYTLQSHFFQSNQSCQSAHQPQSFYNTALHGTDIHNSLNAQRRRSQFNESGIGQTEFPNASPKSDRHYNRRTYMRNDNQNDLDGSNLCDSWRTTNTNLDRVFVSDIMKHQFFENNVQNILLTGLQRSGKTSIAEVVYRKASPHETLFMPPTSNFNVLRVANTNIVKFNIVDCPSSILNDTILDNVIFPRASSLIFVLDAQNEPFGTEIAKCKDLCKRAWKKNPQIQLEIFIHKIDGDYFSVDEVRAECQRDIHDKLMGYLHEEGVGANAVFYSTSIYDQTVFEACSRVVQRLIPHIGTLERLLDVLVTSCKMERAFLVDVLSKTFIATDSSPFDPFHYELCTEMIDVVIEISCIYGDLDNKDTPIDSEVDTDSPESICMLRQNERNRSRSFASNTKCLPKTIDHGISNNDPTNHKVIITNEAEGLEGSTLCLMQLNTGHILYLREVDRLLALACVVREENFDRQFLVCHDIRNTDSLSKSG